MGGACTPMHPAWGISRRSSEVGCELAEGKKPEGCVGNKVVFLQ